jgi:hypothetical protein
MKQNVTLTVTSLLSIVLTSFHFTEDIVRGIEPGKLPTLFGVLLLVVWLYGTLALADQRSGYVIMLLFSALASGIPVLHMMGKGLVGGRIAGSSGVFFWVWTLLVLGVNASFSAILAAWGLWSSRSSGVQR